MTDPDYTGLWCLLVGALIVGVYHLVRWLGRDRREQEAKDLTAWHLEWDRKDEARRVQRQRELARFIADSLGEVREPLPMVKLAARCKEMSRVLNKSGVSVADINMYLGRTSGEVRGLEKALEFVPGFDHTSMMIKQAIQREINKRKG